MSLGKRSEIARKKMGRLDRARNEGKTGKEASEEDLSLGRAALTAPARKKRRWRTGQNSFLSKKERLVRQPRG